MVTGLRAKMLCVLGVALCAADGSAAAGIARCVGVHGEPMFAQRCGGASLSTVAAATPPRSRPAPAQPAVLAAGATRLCARSPQQLAERVQAAIHARNGVRLSGYALWRGRSGGGVRSEVRALLQVLKAGSADVQLRYRDDPSTFDTADATATRNESALVIASLSEQGSALHSGERWFGVARDHGCYWLTLAPPVWITEEPASNDRQPDTANLAWDMR